MTALNIRGIDPALRTALKVEATAAGLGLAEYCIKILSERSAKFLTPQDVIQRLDPGPPPAKLDYWDGQPDPIPNLRQDSPVAKPFRCPHGWMNRVLCPECKAGL